jgi:hypothetical protein
MKIERDQGGAGTPARRREESSVVFSLANLRQMVDAQRPEPARPAALPGFAGHELVGVATAAAPKRATVSVPAVAAPSNLPLLIMLGALLVVVIGLGAYVVATPPQQVVITRVVAPQNEDDARSEPEPLPVVAVAREHEVAPPQVVTEDQPVEPQRVTKRTRTQTRQPREEHTVTPPKPEPERRGDVPLECVLDPNLPKCGGKTVTPRTETKSPKVDPELPETLGSTAIKNGIAAVKGSAKMCGDKFGAADGEKVRVKLSIVGATGAVSSTAAEDPHRGTALGNCVAAALKRATFPHFRKSVIGVEYTITL